jgi:galactose oxidase
MAKEVQGNWTDNIVLSTVAVHASLLPTGKVLYWGRRAKPKSPLLIDHNLDEHFTAAFLWDPKTRTNEPILPANQPFSIRKERVNLFCSGHCFLPDGTLLVVGGHLKDGVGVNQACIYDPKTNKFIPQTLMNGGRWYPSALTLPDGRVLVISGSDNESFVANNIPQIWSPDISKPNTWIEVKDPYSQVEVKDPKTQKRPIFPLYPRVHLSPKGQIFMAGPLAQSLFLDVKDDKGVDIKDNAGVVGTWSDAKTARGALFRDYAPSVMYDKGKIIYMGGGTEVDDGAPTSRAEIIDLNEDKPKWKDTANMSIARKQFNATVLPDGTVLVTGGFSGGGFNDLATAVHKAELWDPDAKQWTEMAAERFDRCYHSVALLLPDGRVLSAGGGEYGGVGIDQCLTDAQLFEPPYLFKGTPPTIVSAPSEISYGTPFPVTVGTSDVIKTVSLVRLGSVTHCRNMNQSFMFLLKDNKQTGSKLMVPAPANENLAPPGHYMLFVLNEKGVPSVAPIIRIPPAPAKTPAPAPAPTGTTRPSARVADIAQHTAVVKTVQPSLLEHNEIIMAEQARPAVVVGITPLCPYGLGPCWAGAHDALHGVSDIEVVRPVPQQADSVAFVYLKQDILPDIDVWRSEFAKGVNRSYEMRGIEMTLSGVVIRKQTGANQQMTLAGPSTRPELILAPFQETSQIKWDTAAKAPKPIFDVEAGAYERLSATLADHPAGVKVQVTGTLQKHGANEFSLDVRDFEVLDAAAS